MDGGKRSVGDGGKERGRKGKGDARGLYRVLHFRVHCSGCSPLPMYMIPTLLLYLLSTDLCIHALHLSFRQILVEHMLPRRQQGQGSKLLPC